MFADDSWHIAPRFTLNLGIRWEPFFPYTDVNNRLAAWHPGQQSTRYVNAPAGVVFPGDDGVPDGGFATTWQNWAPRVGFAWDVFGNGKTSVRGGYGVFYDDPSTIAWNSQADQAPFGTVLSLDGNATNSLANPYAGAVNPFPSPLNPPSDAYSSHSTAPVPGIAGTCAIRTCSRGTSPSNDRSSATSWCAVVRGVEGHEPGEHSRVESGHLCAGRQHVDD